MLPVRNLLFWALALVAGIIVLQLLQQRPNPQQQATPDEQELPDITAEHIHVVRTKSGTKTLETVADFLESYNGRGETYLTNPDVTLFTEQHPHWHIISDNATVFSNNDIHFQGHVVVTQLTEVPNVVVNTEFLSYSEVKQLITTDQPVQAVKGLQRANAVGMEVELDTIRPIIHLLSDVNLEYEPS